MKKGWLISSMILTIVVLIVTLFFIFRVKSYKHNEPIKAIPNSASVIIKVNKINGLKDLVTNDIDFKEELLQSNILSPFFEDLSYVDSIFSNESGLNNLGNQSLYISLHGIGKNNIEALYLTEAKNRQFENVFIDHIKKQYSFSERPYNTIPIFTLKKGETSLPFYLMVYKGIIAGSWSHLLVEGAIRQIQSEHKISDLDGFKEISKTSGRSSQVNIFINFSALKNVLKKFVSDSYKKDIALIDKQSDWGELDLDIKSNALLLNGFFSKNMDGVLSHLFSNNQPQSSSVEEFLPANTKAFCAFNLKDGVDFKTRINKYLNHNGLDQEYYGKLINFKKRTGVDFENLFFQNIKGELALAYTDLDELNKKQNGLLICPVNSQSETKKAYLNALKEAYNDDIEPVSIYQVDEDFSYSIYKGLPDDILKQLLSPLLAHVPQEYFVIFDNNIVFANSLAQLKSFIYSNILNKTLQNKKIYNQFRENFASRENLFVFCELGYLKVITDDLFQPFFKDLSDQQQESLDHFYAIGAQFSGTGDMVYSTVYMNYLPQRESEPHTVWQSLLDTTAFIKPVLVTNHYTQEREVLIQDANHNLYLLGNNGRVLWKKPLSGKILSEIHQIDYYRNNKFQFLFNTAEQIFILDRNGNNVTNFPVKLPSKATNSISMVDYDKDGKFRIFVACENNKVYLYDKAGNRVTGWQFKKSEGRVSLPVQHFRSNDNDYIVFSDEVKSYILNRKGNERIEIKTSFKKNPTSIFYLEGKDTSNEYLITSSVGGGLVKIALKDGSVSEKAIIEADGEYGFSAFKYPTQNEFHYIITLPHEVKLFNHQMKLIFEREFDDEIQLLSDVYQFSASNIKIGIVGKQNNQIFLLNTDGEDYKGFPLQGKDRFSIGFLKSSSSRFNLIVAGMNNYLYNYQVN